ncbi:unnamed protein product, partial [Strongylus vulgaris]
MYGISILFFIYMYVVLLLNPRWYWTINFLEKYLKRAETSQSSIFTTVATVRKATHCGSSTGSLFLRLGCVAFGVTGVVYYAFLVFLCTADRGCTPFATTLDICAVVFIFTQMHFIFCNSKVYLCQNLSITGHHTAARFGTMHLIAANLWTWIRYVLMEEGVMEREVRSGILAPQRGVPAKSLQGKIERFLVGYYREVFHAINNRTEPAMDEEMVDAFGHREVNFVKGCRAAECILGRRFYTVLMFGEPTYVYAGSLSEVMFTAIVEYSLIAAAVMYIVWRNIGKARH